MQVCIVEDDIRLAALLQQALEEDDVLATRLASGAGAAHFIAIHSFDAVVLDMVLPGASGLAVLEELRREHCQTPVLVLSARDTVPEMVRALDMGADDYMTKPFHIDLFLARVRSVSRRGAVPQGAGMQAGAITLDPQRRAVNIAGHEQELSRREFLLLEALVRRANRVVTREQLATAAWGRDADVSQGNLDFHMHSLRAKLALREPCSIRTVRGVGYILQADPRQS